LPDADQRASDRQPIGDRDVELALQHFYRLTPAQQLRAFDEERRFLLAAGETLDRSADELAERAEALRVMGQAAEHLGLADGTAPNGPQFRQGLIAAWPCAWMERAAGPRGVRPLARAQHAASQGRDIPAEHDLITVSEMTASLGHSRAKMDEVKHEPGFPVQVAMLGRAAVYSRADFERWLRGEPLPVRKLNERQHEYLGSRDLAELLGAYR